MMSKVTFWTEYVYTRYDGFLVETWVPFLALLFICTEVFQNKTPQTFQSPRALMVVTQAVFIEI